MREPTFHVFKSGDDAWHDVLPGDGLIAPKFLAYRFNEFIDRNVETDVLRLARAPLIVLSIIDGVYGDDKEAARDSNLATFIVWSRHGALCMIARRKGPRT